MLVYQRVLLICGLVGCSILGPKVPALVTALRIRKSKSFATTSTSRCGEGCSDFEWMRLQTFGFGDFLGIFLQMIVWRVARAHLHPLLLKPSDLNWFGLLLTATLACPFCFRGSVGEALERDHAKASRDQARGADPGVWDRIWDYVATDWDSCESFTSSTGHRILTSSTRLAAIYSCWLMIIWVLWEGILFTSINRRVYVKHEQNELNGRSSS